MCTVSWLYFNGGYELFCNRDEKRTRKTAEPPSIREREGVRYIAPRDGDFGGTWIAANEYGIAFTLLNGYGAAPQAVVSRGLLVLDLTAARSLAEVRSRVEAANLTRFAPFTLLALAAASPPLLCEWTGTDLAVTADAHHRLPLVSSSFDPGGVRAERRERFTALTRKPGRFHPAVLETFHRSHAEQPDAYSTCMHRPDAETASFSRIRVGGGEIRFAYVPDAPCRNRPATNISLPLLPQ